MPCHRLDRDEKKKAKQKQKEKAEEFGSQMESNHETLNVAKNN